MSPFIALILGIIQGLTEFLPVSSSGHLVLWGRFLGFDEPKVGFDVFVHFGTLLAILLYFRRDVWRLMRAPFAGSRDGAAQDRRLLLWLAVSTFITAVIGLLCEDWVDRLFMNPLLAAIMLLVTGFILFVSDRIPTHERTAAQMGWFRAAWLGLAQTFALFPGISRSGTTIVAGLAAGLRRDEAARYAFLLAIPAIGGATVLKFRDMIGDPAISPLSYALGGAAAFISGYAVIGLLLRLVRRQKLRYFAYYCWAFGLVSIVLLLSGVVS
ncbi:MAG: undecaprenyl-diphosphate phosphatase [Candidatus Cloacimonetes bacterium]|nr:undecaprenyl-diphosphate phosphatase [Candidatus Cloacimonadota bacterium]